MQETMCSGANVYTRRCPLRLKLTGVGEGGGGGRILDFTLVRVRAHTNTHTHTYTLLFSLASLVAVHESFIGNIAFSL